jgi:uncharacterized membrane protein
MIGLGDLQGGSFLSRAYGVSEASSVVGASSAAEGVRAFIWDAAHGMRHLRDVLINDYGVMNLSGWTLVEARAITPDGKTIVGSGINPLGQQEAWLAHIPEPASAMLMLLAIPLCRRSRRGHCALR